MSCDLGIKTERVSLGESSDNSTTVCFCGVTYWLICCVYLPSRGGVGGGFMGNSKWVLSWVQALCTSRTNCFPWKLIKWSISSLSKLESLFAFRKIPLKGASYWESGIICPRWQKGSLLTSLVDYFIASKAATQQDKKTVLHSDSIPTVTGVASWGDVTTDELMEFFKETQKTYSAQTYLPQPGLLYWKKSMRCCVDLDRLMTSCASGKIPSVSSPAWVWPHDGSDP